MYRIAINVETGEQTQIELTAEDIAQAQVTEATWQAEQAARQTTPTLDQIIQTQTTTINELTARILALENA
jgi:hypothetical protein